MGNRKKVIAGAATIAVVAFASVAAFQARAVGWKASGVRAGMSFAEVSRQLDGWAMINGHPLGRGTQNRAKPGPEYFGYSGEVYVLTPVEPDGRETDLRKISRAEFEQRVEKLLSDGEPWTVYFNFRMIVRDSGVLVRFDGRGKVAGSRQPSGFSEPIGDHFSLSNEERQTAGALLEIQLFGSMPMRSLTAPRMRCLLPRYLSVV